MNEKKLIGLRIKELRKNKGLSQEKLANALESAQLSDSPLNTLSLAVCGKIGWNIMEVIMPKTIEAIYENGVFKPLKKIRLNEHQKVELTILTEKEMDIATKTALDIIGIGKSSFKDTAQKHDEYLYGKNRCLLKRTK